MPRCDVLTGPGGKNRREDETYWQTPALQTPLTQSREPTWQ
jgi:hypothetical protein